MLPKTSAYVKRYDVETKWMYFLIEDDNLRLFGLKSVLILKKKLIASLSIINPLENKNKLNLQIFTIKDFLTWIVIILAEKYLAWILLKER